MVTSCPLSDAGSRPGPMQTVGHGTLAAGAFVDVLRGARVDGVADVRRYPGSARHPQFNRRAMQEWLRDAGIEYRWIEALGGRRKVNPDSRHVALRNEQFRAYGDHMATAEFASGLTELFELTTGGRRVAVMCSESVWWRCHRRLLADHLVLVAGVAVEHLFHDGRTAAHAPTPGARAESGVVVYDGSARGS